MMAEQGRNMLLIYRWDPMVYTGKPWEPIGIANECTLINNISL